MQGERIRVTGSVQGVGFRPTVWRLANDHELVGQVWNDAEGVLIQVWGSSQSLEGFVHALQAEQPPLSRIDKIVRLTLDEQLAIPADFQIAVSQKGKVSTNVIPDAATCPECLAEVMDPSNRRYRYPFTNCTHCGPRMSIVRKIPYDRMNTSMVSFPMCPQCLNEYQEPNNRRFHAQPNACHDCGPQVWLEDVNGVRLKSSNDCDTIETAARLIRQGKIVAIKGIGGIHLACDAGNSDAVNTLRHRKQRYHKALALMASDINMVQRYAKVSDSESALLSDNTAPIVVLDKSGEELPVEIAPGQNSLGFMLPYTPLHHLLMQNMLRPIVLTSGNRSNEPQIINNQTAHESLDHIVDYFLLHDRDIVSRLDDSVLRMIADQPRFLRLARGYAPRSLKLADDFSDTESILAMGGELKNTFCLLNKGRVILSQHMGDLENVTTYQDYQQNLKRYLQLFDFMPTLIVVDKHPNYLSTQYGQLLAVEKNIPLLEVQHHHAHIAGCMAEHRLPLKHSKVLGITLDGAGFGEDETIWGGNFFWPLIKTMSA